MLERILLGIAGRLHLHTTTPKKTNSCRGIKTGLVGEIVETVVIGEEIQIRVSANRHQQIEFQAAEPDSRIE